MERCHAHVCGIQHIDDLRARVARAHVVDTLLQDVMILGPTGVMVVVRIRSQVFHAEDGAYAPPLPVADDADEHLFIILAGKQIVDRRAVALAGVALRTHGLRRLAGELCGGHMLADVKQRGLEQAAGDVLPLACFLPLHERRHDAEHGIRCRTHVDYRCTGTHRLPGRTGHEGQARRHLSGLVHQRSRSIGALEVALEAAINETRIDLPHLGVTQAQPVHRARRHILNQYISAIDKPHRHFTAIRRGEIDNNAALVAIEVVERTIAPVAHAAFLAGIGRLHLDHIGAHIAEQQAGSRPGHDLPHFDNVYSFQR